MASLIVPLSIMGATGLFIWYSMDAQNAPVYVPQKNTDFRSLGATNRSQLDIMNTTRRSGDAHASAYSQIYAVSPSARANAGNNYNSAYWHAQQAPLSEKYTVSQ
jgi:hypothetical protein